MWIELIRIYDPKLGFRSYKACGARREYVGSGSLEWNVVVACKYGKGGPMGMKEHMGNFGFATFIHLRILAVYDSHYLQMG